MRAPGLERKEMEDAMRRSGIEVIGDVPWGTHFCQFYETSQDLIETLVPYFKEGLAAGEFCMWVTSEPLRVDQAEAALRAEVPDLDSYLDKGQIEILDYSQWYTRSGKFCADEVLQGWVDKLSAAQKQGYRGLRLTGNTFWLEKADWDDFTRYEEKVNNVIGRYPMLAICTYSLSRCNAAEIIDVIANHQFALIKRSGLWDTIESSHHKKIEQALRDNEERYSTTLSSIGDAVIATDVEGNITFMNAVAEDLTRWTIIQALHKPSKDVFRIVNEYTRREVEDPVARVLKRGAIVGLANHTILVKRDGTEVPIDDSGAPIKDQNGNITGTVLVFRDITGRKRQEDKIAKLTRLYAVLSQANEIIVRVRDEQSLYKEVCRIVAEIGGFPLVWIGEARDNQVVPVACSGPDADYLKEIRVEVQGEFSKGPTGTCIRENRTVVNDDFATNPATKPWRKSALGYGFHASAAFPLRLGGRAIGSFTLYAYEQSAFDAEQVGLLESLSSDISYALDAIDHEQSRIRTEKALRETGDYLENLINYANAPIIVWDTSFKITRFNHAFERLVGLRAAEAIGEPLDMLFPKSSKDGSWEYIQRALSGEYWEAVEIPILKTDGSVRTVLWNSANICDEDGTTIVATIAQGQDITERKQAEVGLQAINDILRIANRNTDLNSMLGETVSYLKGFSRCSAVGIRLLDEDGNIPYQAYDGFSQSFYERESPLSIKSDRCMCINIVKGDIDPKQPFYTEGGSFYMNGTTRFLANVSEEDKGQTRNVCNQVGYESVALIPIRFENNILGLIQISDQEENMVPQSLVEVVEKIALQLGTAIVRIKARHALKESERELRLARDELELRVKDRTAKLSEAKECLEVANEELQVEISEHEKLERDLIKAKDQALEAVEAKAAFLANMSHELRTPLNAVIGYSSLLLDESPTPVQKDYIESIRKGGEALLALISDILDISRTEKKKVVLEHQPLSLRHCIEESMEMVAPMAVEKGLDLAYTIRYGTPEAVMGDPGRLRQVLVNLLSNAVKFTDFGGVSLSMSSKSLGDNKCSMLFEVKDTGIGIPSDKMDQLFLPFSQVEYDISRKRDGAGLGLAISKNLVEMMGGTIWAQSEPGKGSTFRFTISTEVVSGKCSNSEDLDKEAVFESTAELKQMAILVAEDNHSNQRVLVDILKRMGYRPDAVADGKEVLQILRIRPYDLIFMDIKMPEINGLDATREIRKAWPAERQPKIIAVTAYAMDGDREMCLQAGMDGYIAKPVQRKELESILRRYSGETA